MGKHMHTSRIATLVAIATPSLCLAQLTGPPRPGDLVVSSTLGTSGLLAVDPASGRVRGVVSELAIYFGDGDATVLNLGSGESFEFAKLAYAPDGRLFARNSRRNEADHALLEIDVATGDRIPLPGTDTEVLDGYFSDLLFLDDRTILTGASTEPRIDFFERVDRGALYTYDLESQQLTLVSGVDRGDGPVFQTINEILLLDPNTALVTDSDPGGCDDCHGFGLFRVDLATGDRTLVSRLSQNGYELEHVIGGVLQPTPFVVADDDFGDGPVTNIFRIYDLIITSQGRILVSSSLDAFDIDAGVIGGAQYAGGLLEIDPSTGDRSLIAGYAIDDLDGEIVAMSPLLDPSISDSLVGLMENPDGTVFGIPRFDNEKPIHVLDLNGATVEVRGGIEGEYIGVQPLDVVQAPSSACEPDLAPPLGALDFNDVTAFLAAFADSRTTADFAPPVGLLNFNDVLAFLEAFAVGCP